MRFRTWKIKFTVLFILLISSVIASGVGIYHYFNVSRLIRERIFSQLNFTAKSKAEVVETYIAGFEYEAKILSDVISLELTQDDLHLPEITSLLTSLKSQANEIAHVDLISPEGIAIASSDPAKVGEDRTAKATYINGKNELFFNDLHSASGSKKPAFGISMPVKNQKNELLGVVLVDVDADKLYRILANESSFGEYGEMFLVNKDNLLVSPSRYLNDAFLQKRISIANVDTCKNHEHETHPEDTFGLLSLYKGLSGKTVLGTHTYIPNRYWCLIAEVDEYEFLTKPLQRLLTLSGISISLSLMLFFLVAFALFKTIISPIQIIHKAMQNVAQGKFDQKVMIDSGNEIGDLARIFNAMTGKLANHYVDLESEVKQKTEELSKEIESRKETENKLESSLAELQRVNKFMTDRELRMIELKNRIKELEK